MDNNNNRSILTVYVTSAVVFFLTALGQSVWPDEQWWLVGVVSVGAIHVASFCVMLSRVFGAISDYKPRDGEVIARAMIQRDVETNARIEKLGKELSDTIKNKDLHIKDLQDEILKLHADRATLRKIIDKEITDNFS